MKTYPIQHTGLLCVSALFFTTISSHANVTFTYIGTANSTAVGYTENQPVSFSFVTNSAVTGPTVNSFFDSQTNWWQEQLASDDAMFTSITGTGLSGNFVRPIQSSEDPHTYIYMQNDLQVIGSDSLVIAIFNDSNTSYGLGLLANGGSATVDSLHFVTYRGPNLSFPASFSEPVNYFANAAGVYNLSSIYSSLEIRTSEGPIVFKINQLIISPAAVPEPSMYTVFSGLFVFAIVFYRRLSK